MNVKMIIVNEIVIEIEIYKRGERYYIYIYYITCNHNHSNQNSNND